MNRFSKIQVFKRSVTSCLSLMTILLTGCAAGLISEATVGSMAVRTIVTDIAAANTLATAEAVAIAGATFAVTTAGRVTITNSTSANRLLSRVRLHYTKGAPPKLFELGETRPFAEINTKTRKIHNLKKNDVPYDIPVNLFSVRNNSVIIRKQATNTSSNVGIAYKGDLVVKEIERNGWYRIRIIRNAKVTEGWVPMESIFALALMGDEEDQKTNPKEIVYSSPEKVVSVPAPQPIVEDDCARQLTGEYTFVNKMNKSLTVRLFPGSMPTEYMGNPGEEGEILTLAAYESKTFYSLRSGVYKYWVRENFLQGLGGIRYESRGQIKVETCKTLSSDIR